jgi:hypothetical protein
MTQLFKRSFFDDFEISGEWWIPGKKRNKQAGTLKFSPATSPKLELIGEMPFIRLNRKSGQRRVTITLGTDRFLIGIILGDTDVGPVTLVTCKGFPLDRSAEVELILQGVHLNSITDLSIHSLNINFTHFEKWLGGEVFRKKERCIFSDKGFEPGTFKKQVGYTHPRASKYKLRTLDAIFAVSHLFRDEKSDYVTHVEWEYSGFLSLEFLKAKSWQEAEEICSDFQKILAFLAYEPIYFNHVQLNAEKRKNKDQIQIEAFFYQRANYIKQNVDSEKIMFPFSELKAKFPKLVDKWIKHKEILSIPLSLYTGHIYEKSINIDTQFLFMTQAIETLHRRSKTRKLHLVPPKKYKTYYQQIITSLPNTLPETLKEKIVNTLQYANEPSLGTRLKELLKELEQETVTAITPKVSKFVSSVVTARNYKTHYSPESELKALRDKELIPIIQKLKILLLILLGKELGLSEKQILSAVRRRSVLAHFLEHGRSK